MTLIFASYSFCSGLFSVFLILMTLSSLAILFIAVEQGLLGSPDMQIVGNQSTAEHLKWYQDRSNALLPTATVVSVPLLSYRIMMLIWSLWLAISLLDWLQWGWQCFSANGVWKKSAEKIKPVSEKRTCIKLKLRALLLCCFCLRPKASSQETTTSAALTGI
jgi:hypothetical protein